MYGFSCTSPTPLARGFPFRAYALHTCPHSSVLLQYRNFYLLSIGYAFQPLLRPTYPEQISFTPETLDIRPQGFPPCSRYSFQHSLFLSLHRSLRYCFFPHAMLLYQPFGSLVSVARFSPGHFRRRTSRPVSYYALFEWMAASEPTSWLSSKSHILFHLTRTWGP